MTDPSRTRVVHVNDHVPGAVYIGRAVPRKGLKGSIWANPHKVGPNCSRADAVKWYRADFGFQVKRSPTYYRELQKLVGKPLACWCRHDGEERTEDNACHGDVLVELIQEMGLESSP